MAPVVNQAPTALQMPPTSAVDKYKSYVRSNSNPSHQFDDNMKEPNNNNPVFNNPSNNNNNNLGGKNDFNDESPQFFTCYTSYSCTPTDIPEVQSSQKMSGTSQMPSQANQGKSQMRFEPNNNQVNSIESDKPGSNVPYNNIMATPSSPQTPQLNSVESFGHPSQMNQTNQINIQRIVESGKPAPHAQINNIKNTPNVPSPLIMINDANPEQPPRQRKTSNPGLVDRPQVQYGLAHSRSSPVISSKGSPPSQNESLVQQYFQNPQAHKNLQEKQLTGQGPVQRNMLPPPAPPAGRSKSTSPRNSFTEKRSSVPNAKTGDGKSNDWEKVLTKFYQW